MPSQPSTAGIVTDESSGQRHIPESKRADGTTRKAIKIRPGYRPPEDVEVYKNRTAENFRSRGRAMGVPGAAGVDDDRDNAKAEASNSASNKNAKRREARKKAKAAAEADADNSNNNNNNKSTNGNGSASQGAEAQQGAPAADETPDPEAEREKKARNLKKKLRQAKELKDKKDGGQSLLPEQIAKVIKINELIRELDALGFDQDGEPKVKSDEAAAAKGKNDANN